MVRKGDFAPAFTLKNQQGEPVSLEDFYGRWSVLYFYPRDFTSGCTKEAIDFTERKADFEALGAVVLGVSPDSPERHQRFIEKNGLEITLLSDEERGVLKMYGPGESRRIVGRRQKGSSARPFSSIPRDGFKRSGRRCGYGLNVRVARRGMPKSCSRD